MTATKTSVLRHEDALRAHRLDCVAALTTGVAHGLNNHLSAIAMLLDALEIGLDGDQAALAASLRDGIGRSIHTVRQMESLARHGEAEPLLYQPLYVVKDVLNLLWEGFPPEVVEISDDLSETCLIEGNPTLLHQLVLAFSLDALIALKEGGELILRMRSAPRGESGSGSADSRPSAEILLRVDIESCPARPAGLKPEATNVGPPAELLADFAAEGGWVSEHHDLDRRVLSLHLPAAPEPPSL